jgi:hypothetical protein
MVEQGKPMAPSAHNGAGSKASERRVGRIREIAGKLLDVTVLNTASSRARCLELAAEMVQLITDEDAYQQRGRSSAFAEYQETIQRAGEAQRACREAGEQAELTRLYTASERIHRKKGDSSR